MLESLIALLLGAIGNVITDLIADWRRDKALQDLGASRVESAQQKATLDALAQRQKAADDVNRLPDADVTAELRKWARKT